MRAAVTVTLPRGYLPRNTTLRVGRYHRKRGWELQACDGNGTYFTEVKVNGFYAPKCGTRKALLEWCESQGVDFDAKVWSTPYNNLGDCSS